MTIAEDGSYEMRHWRDVSREQYTWVLGKNSATDRICHHLAILARLRCSAPEIYFDSIVSQFFYGTKALVVKTPFFNIRESLLTLSTRSSLKARKLRSGTASLHRQNKLSYHRFSPHSRFSKARPPREKWSQDWQGVPSSGILHGT